MSVNKIQSEAAAAAAASQLGLKVRPDFIDRLTTYLDLLERWNRRIRLVAPATRGVWIERHVLDSIQAAAAVPDDARTLLDVGAGAGLPGLIIALLRPELDVTALDPIHKKRAFVATAARETAAKVSPHAERFESHMVRAAHRYDVAISRATWSVSEWLARGAEAVMPGGLVLGMEGREQEPLVPGAIRHPYALGDRTRAIITYRPPMDPGPRTI